MFSGLYSGGGGMVRRKQKKIQEAPREFNPFHNTDNNNTDDDDDDHDDKKKSAANGRSNNNGGGFVSNFLLQPMKTTNSSPDSNEHLMNGGNSSWYNTLTLAMGSSKHAASRRRKVVSRYSSSYYRNNPCHAMAPPKWCLRKRLFAGTRHETTLLVFLLQWLFWLIVLFVCLSSLDITDNMVQRSIFANSLRGVTRGHHPDSYLRPTNELIDMRQVGATLAFDNADGGAWKQGWPLSPVTLNRLQTPLQVIVVPHSHCDPGWIQTFDEYFQLQVKNILTSVIDGLLADERRTFIWAEISYFAWWWNEQSPERKQQVKDLLDKRQLEFVTGGWVQPDEANSHYFALETQLQEGHDWIKTHLGAQYIPKYSWSIDPFGYSPTYAYLLKKYGFQGMLIQRVHYAVKKLLAQHKHLEFYWRQTFDSGDDERELHEFDIFTHVMPFFSYDVPHTCGPDPAVCCQFDFYRFPTNPDGPECPWQDSEPVEISDENVAERALLLLDQYQKKASIYRSRVVLAPLGDDFRYQSKQEVELQYQNHQRIHDYINQHVPGVQIQFGTLSQYFERVLGSFHPPVLKGSFFTYSDVDADYWSGYYTSRVFDKALDRQLERVLYAAQQVATTAAGSQQQQEGGGKKNHFYALQQSRRALSLFQHHDGVTGTARDSVVYDYANRLYNSLSWTQQYLLQQLVQVYPQEAAAIPNIQPCLQALAPRQFAQNLCAPKSTVLVYNPLANNNNNTTQLCGTTLIEGGTAKLADLPCQVVGRAPPKELPTELVALQAAKEEEARNAMFDLEIEAAASPRNDDAHPPPQLAAMKRAQSIASKLVFDPETGMLLEPIREDWKVWTVEKGGAYLFFPNRLLSYPQAFAENQRLQAEMERAQAEWEEQELEGAVDSGDFENFQRRLLADEEEELKYTVLNNGYVVETPKWKRTISIPQYIPDFNQTSSDDEAIVLDLIYETQLDCDNQEWIVRLGAPIHNHGLFYTDLNGFTFDTHIFRPDLPIQSQVFPMPTLASIQDLVMTHDDDGGLATPLRRLTVLSEHAQGTAHLTEGSIDVWLDRRLAQDDGKGLDQGVQDNRRVITKLRVILEPRPEPKRPHNNKKPKADQATLLLLQDDPQYTLTPLTRQLWNTLQHPLQIFGQHVQDASPATAGNLQRAASNRERIRQERRRQQKQHEHNTFYRSVHKVFKWAWHALTGSSATKPEPAAKGQALEASSSNNRFLPSKTIVPFVYMVYKRVDYLKKAMDSLKASDFPSHRVPVIISHDGRVPEVWDYVEHLRKTEFPRLIQIVHPFSCYEHPNTFPGNDPKLNIRYKGDGFGNTRSAWATCAKHHFTWLMAQVFEPNFVVNSLEKAVDDDDAATAMQSIDTFLFLEEDYVVSKSVYKAIVMGMNVMQDHGHLFHDQGGGLFGLCLDPTLGNAEYERSELDPDIWYPAPFHSGPFTLNRNMFTQLQQHAQSYCRFDEYNWDWSIVHMQGLGLLPYQILLPSRLLAKHIGESDGMHHGEEANNNNAANEGEFVELGPDFFSIADEFVGNKLYFGEQVDRVQHVTGYGGWSHPADQEHCMRLLTNFAAHVQDER